MEEHMEETSKVDWWDFFFSLFMTVVLYVFAVMLIRGGEAEFVFFGVIVIVGAVISSILTIRSAYSIVRSLHHRLVRTSQWFRKRIIEERNIPLAIIIASIIVVFLICATLLVIHFI